MAHSNSNELPKQHKEKLPHNNNNNDSGESIFRIRLPIRRQNDDPEVMVTTTNKDQERPCPSRR
ncbi:hypothetical protein HID58_093880 [Brassica napus]|uniref:Uncharacterized protein n=1 Tax=Brassica napus TaxID=3708 RepID=A0ABQ7X9I2_BRANA|nr:hypothetical protein HID58_093880 [Brassica napus]